MKKVLVTGASSGIGKAIGEKILNMGYELIGVSRHINKDTFEKEFLHFNVDLSDEKQTIEFCKQIKKESHKLVIAISSRALFNLDHSHKIFKEEGIEAYAKHQQENESLY